VPAIASEPTPAAALLLPENRRLGGGTSSMEGAKLLFNDSTFRLVAKGLGVSSSK
jgi:hypothetical protein